jgi:hypothetical protein
MTWKSTDLAYLAGFVDGEGINHHTGGKSAPITADGTSALNRALTSSPLHSSMEDVPMLIWIGIATLGSRASL